MGNFQENSFRIYKNGKVTIVDYKKQGANNRKSGAKFELDVRKDLIKRGYTVVKNQNNIDLDKDKFVPAKQKFIKGRGMGLGSGFPDFIAFMNVNRHINKASRYELMFVEAKSNGTLSKEEKLKMNWLLKNEYTCWIGYKNEKGKPIYRKFVEYKECPKVSRK